MPVDTATQLLEAQKAYTLAEGDEARRVALSRFLAAEEAHLDAMAVERGPGRVGYFVGFAVMVLLIVVLIVSVSNSSSASDTANAVADLQRESVVSNREACQRANDGRVASINEKRQSVQSLGKQLRFWDSLRRRPTKPTPQPILALFDAFVDGLREEVATKREAIRGSVESQASVAVRPGSARTDCARAYPFQ